MSMMQRPCTVFIMQYFNHILTIVSMYGEIPIKNINPVFILQIIVIQVFCHARSLDHTSQMLVRYFEDI